MYNARYHIASLVGVFLALALGLVLGGLVVQNGAVDRQQTALVSGLQKEFSALRYENKALSAENELLREYAGTATDVWAADQLVGKTVLIVASSTGDDGFRAAKSAVEDAGGTVAVVTIEKADLGLEDEAVRSVISSFTGDAREVEASVITSLVAEWASPVQERPLTAALAEAGALTLTGLDPGMAAAGLVDIAVKAEKAEPAGALLAGAFAQTGAPGAGAEVFGSKSGVASAAVQRGASGFDTLGTVVGRYSLVALMSGAKSGAYGVNDAATAPYPPVPKD